MYLCVGRFPFLAVWHRQPVLLAQSQRPVHRDPAHHLAVGEVEVLAADLPETGIALLPSPAGEVDNAAQLLPQLTRDLASVEGPDEDGVEELAEDVELDLVLGAVADPHRP